MKASHRRTETYPSSLPEGRGVVVRGVRLGSRRKTACAAALAARTHVLALLAVGAGDAVALAAAVPTDLIVLLNKTLQIVKVYIHSD